MGGWALGALRPNYWILYPKGMDFSGRANAKGLWYKTYALAKRTISIVVSIVLCGKAGWFFT
jgi:hypothetical protein